MDYDMYINLGLALGLGLLVGLQREVAKSKLAGIRTFPIVTMAGAIVGALATALSNAWIIGFGGLAVAILTLNSNYIQIQRKVDNTTSGQTTEAALILMYFLGAFLVIGDRSLGLIIGAVTAVLLHLKPSMHKTAEKLGPKDTKAIMLFAVISLIVLPILPDENYGPLEVFNPFQIWLMVVLIVGLSVVGYFIYKWLGPSKGTLAGGILGGLISSTATTISYSRRSQANRVPYRPIFLVIMLASTVSFARIIIEIGIVAPAYLMQLAPPLAVMLVLMSGYCVYLYTHDPKKQRDDLPEPKNPAQLTTALVFGGLYAIIVYAVAAGKEYFGETGLYFVSFISGLTDVDAITLSLSNSVKNGQIEASQAWQLIMTGAMANLIFKSGLAAFLGSSSLRRHILWATGVIVVVGVAVIIFWPF